MCLCVVNFTNILFVKVMFCKCCWQLLVDIIRLMFHLLINTTAVKPLQFKTTSVMFYIMSREPKVKQIWLLAVEAELNRRKWPLNWSKRFCVITNNQLSLLRYFTVMFWTATCVCMRWLILIWDNNAIWRHRNQPSRKWRETRRRRKMLQQPPVSWR